MAASASFGPKELGPTWSLAIEEQFYLLLPAIIILVPPAKLPHLLLPLIAASFVARPILSVIYDNQYAPYLLLPGRMDALFLGVLVAWLVRHPPSMNWLTVKRAQLYGVAGVLFCMLILLSWFSPGWFGSISYLVGYPTLSLFYFVIVLLVATATVRLPHILKPLSWMGLGAYSLYLFHMPIFLIVSKYFPSYPLSLSMLVLICLSTLLWRIVEKPIIGFGRTKFNYASRARTRLPELV
jgi:peptidoglycan/LPS O-acetylase OafA/YrhL